MDPAIAAIDLVKAGAIVASMVESYLAAAVPSLDAKGADDDDGQNYTGAAPVADGLCLHPAIDAGAGPLQSREHRTPVQSGQQGAVAWRVTIPGHRPGYITWERFLANRQRLAANRTNGELPGGPAREGLCLLQGMLICGICGRRFSVRYTGNGGLYPTHLCNWQHREALQRHACMTLPAAPLDAAIAGRLLTAVTPAAIELALNARTMSSCNGVPTIWAIKPIRTAGCAVKTSCNGERAALSVLPVESVGCAIETSCNAAPARRPLRQ